MSWKENDCELWQTWTNTINGSDSQLTLLKPIEGLVDRDTPYVVLFLWGRRCLCHGALFCGSRSNSCLGSCLVLLTFPSFDDKSLQHPFYASLSLSLSVCVCACSFRNSQSLGVLCPFSCPCPCPNSCCCGEGNADREFGLHGDLVTNMSGFGTNTDLCVAGSADPTESVWRTLLA